MHTHQSGMSVEPIMEAMLITGVPHHTGTVGLGILTNQVAGQEATMGTHPTRATRPASVFLLEHLLNCKLQGGADHAAASSLTS